MHRRLTLSLAILAACSTASPRTLEGEAPDTLHTQIVRLQHTQAQDFSRQFTELLEDTQAQDPSRQIAELLEDVLAPRHGGPVGFRVAVLAEQNALAISGPPEQVREAVELIGRLDAATAAGGR